MTFKNFIQIAGIIDSKEAQMLTECGIEYLGFPLRLPVNKEDISEEEAENIIANFPPQAKGVLITYLNMSTEIITLTERIGVKIIQLHGHVSLTELSKLRTLKSNYHIIKSLIVGKHSRSDLIETIKEVSEFVDAFIIDSYNPRTGATGATGIVHDWQVSKDLVESSAKPIILAGGLTPDNVYDAILKVGQSGVDVHTGVEDNMGRKNRKKVIKFVKEAKRAFRKLEITQ